MINQQSAQHTLDLGSPTAPHSAETTTLHARELAAASNPEIKRLTKKRVDSRLVLNEDSLIDSNPNALYQRIHNDIGRLNIQVKGQSVLATEDFLPNLMAAGASPELAHQALAYYSQNLGQFLSLLTFVSLQLDANLLHSKYTIDFTCTQGKLQVRSQLSLFGLHLPNNDQYLRLETKLTSHWEFEPTVGYILTHIHLEGQDRALAQSAILTGKLEATQLQQGEPSKLDTQHSLIANILDSQSSKLPYALQYTLLRKASYLYTHHMVNSLKLSPDAVPPQLDGLIAHYLIQRAANQLQDLPLWTKAKLSYFLDLTPQEVLRQILDKPIAHCASLQLLKIMRPADANNPIHQTLQQLCQHLHAQPETLKSLLSLSQTWDQFSADHEALPPAITQLMSMALTHCSLSDQNIRYWNAQLQTHADTFRASSILPLISTYLNTPELSVKAILALTLYLADAKTDLSPEQLNQVMKACLQQAKHRLASASAESLQLIWQIYEKTLPYCGQQRIFEHTYAYYKMVTDSASSQETKESSHPPQATAATLPAASGLVWYNRQIQSAPTLTQATNLQS